MMAAAMAHELNTPIAAADSAAGEAERAALDVLSYARRNPDLEPLAQAAAAVLVGLADAYDPDYALNGLDRRKSSKIAEACLARVLQAAGIEPVDELDAFILAGRLVDLGVTASDSADMETVAGALGVCTDMTLSLLAAAEIVVSSRVIKSGMAKAHAVVSTIKGYTASESPGGRRPVRVSASVEDAIALLYTRTKKGVELKVSLLDDPWIVAEPGLLHRVWMSMLGNALDAIGYHGYIGIRISVIDGFATIDFEDSGQAVPEEMLQFVWNPEFGQKIHDIRGGMNLASIRRLIDMTGGQASCAVVSARTIFSIRFPARDGEGSSGAGS
jgi:signal transduction histidine kinase